MHFIGVLNRDGGTFRTMDMDAFGATVTRILGEQGHTVDCRIVAGPDVVSALATAAGTAGIDALLAGGGDGTVSAAAEIAYRSGVALAILPAGTMNLFARSLQLPLGLEDALRAIAISPISDVDIASANGRPFVHQYSVGLHARLVRIRESLTYRSRLGKIVASLRALVTAIARPPRFVAEVRTRRGIERRNCSAITVTNNPLGEGHGPHADGLQGGVLAIYVAKPMTITETARLCFGVLLGSWKANPLVSEHEVDRVTLTFPRKKHTAQATIDGELIALDSRVDLRILPGALKIIAPATTQSAAAA